MLTAQSAWPLALLLARWAFAKVQNLGASEASDLDLRSYRDIVAAFDLFESALMRLVRAVASPREPSDTVALAGLGAQFAAMAERIGGKTLRDLLASPRYQAIGRTLIDQYPIPNEVADAFGEAPKTAQRSYDRIRDYNRFDFPSRDKENSVGFLCRQLDDPKLSPELRMYYEQQIEFQGLQKYRSDDEARRIWAAMLESPMQDEVRDYYAENLKSLTATDDYESEA
jgi:hypothetical protein